MKPGDLIRCVSGRAQALNLGSVYRVIDVDHSLVWLEGVKGFWSMERFEPYEAHEEADPYQEAMEALEACEQAQGSPQRG